MRSLPLNIRQRDRKLADDEIDVVLVVLRHPDEPEPFRISSDNGVRYSAFGLAGVPEYGTNSTWQVEEGEPAARFDFVAMLVMVPDENDDNDVRSRIVIDLRDARLIELVTSDARRLVTVDMAVVNAAAPDTLLYEMTGMSLMATEFGGAIISFEFALDLGLDEAHPAHTQTRERLQALYPS